MRCATFVSALFLLACGSGSPPTITALASPEPAVVAVGRATQLKVGVAVTDEDGDLDEMRVKLTSPSGQATESTLDVAEQAGKARNSTITMLLSVLPTAPGTYTIQVIAADVDGNISDPRSVDFTTE